MRRIGSLSDETQAERFRDFLTTESIDAFVDVAEGASGSHDLVYEIWIRDESAVDRARALLEDYRRAPDDSRFNRSQQAGQIRDQRIAENIKRKSFTRAAPMRRASATGGLPGGVSVRQQSIPITVAILVISVISSFATSFGNPRRAAEPGEYSAEEKIFATMCFLDPREVEAPEYVIDDPFKSIKNGELWRLVTPLFLHGSTFHLLFNMLWIYSLGSMIERLHGSVFFLVLTVVTQIVGMLVQVMFPETLGGSPFAIGASGAVYGLFGYLWIRPLIDASFPIRLAPTNVALMLGWLVLCFTPMIPNVANGGHLGGLIAGMAAAPLVCQLRS